MSVDSWLLWLAWQSNHAMTVFLSTHIQKDVRTIVGSVRACAKKKDLDAGTKIHAIILKNGLLEQSLDALINMYAKCGALTKAKGLLDGLLLRDLYSWTALISGYAQHGQGQEALNCFDQMQKEGILPDAVTYTCVLKACGNTGAIERGERIHDEICKQGLLGKEIALDNSLVDMYAKCGALAKARRVLEELPVRDSVSWTSLIAAYAQRGNGQEALICFDQLQHEGISPDIVTFTCILKACGSIRAIERGEQIKEDIWKRGLLDENSILGNALVDMYAKCGAFTKAQQVLEELPARDVGSWNALIAGYVDHGKGQDALNCFEKMRHEGLAPNGVTFTSMLKSCVCIGAVDKGIRFHDEIVRQGLLGTSTMLGTALVDMYAKCGALARARGALQELPHQDVVSWNALITGYVMHGQGQDALNCFDEMQRKRISPDLVTLCSILKACGSMGALEKGEKVHNKISRQGLLENKIELSNALVDMYAKCGAFEKAHQVLQELPARDAVSWTSIISGYAQQGKGQDALDCYDQMQREGLLPDAVTFTCILKACASIRACSKGEKIHEEIQRQGLLENNIVLRNSLIDMYAKCGALTKAQQVLHDCPSHNIVSWNALIAGYVDHGKGQDALSCFNKLQHEGLSPDEVTFTSVLKACGSLGAADKGEQIHDEIVRHGLLEKNIVLGNALVDMYAKCGALERAQQVLEDLPYQDVVAWNALITGHAQQMKGEGALICFEEMQRNGTSPDAVTFACILKACGGLGAADVGEHVHNRIILQGLLEKDIVLGNALVDMYAKCGAIEKSQQVFEELSERDVVSWNALMAGYAQKGHVEEALKSYERMLREGLFPDAVSFVCVLKSCSSIGALEKGEEIHDEITNQGLLENNILVGNALVDMYAKCGALGKAQEVLKKLPARDVVTWNALIAGYAQQGQDDEAANCLELMKGEGLFPDAFSWNAVIAGYGQQGKVVDALNCLREMLRQGTSPDSVTFACMLSACSHGGYVEDGQAYFEKMSRDFGISPDVDHYVCMVDLFGRAGHLDKAVAIIHRMPSSNHYVVWRVLLGACWKWRDVFVGKWAFEHAVQVDKGDTAAYVLMANIYAASGMQEEAENVEVLRLKNRAWKDTECSWWIGASEFAYLGYKTCTKSMPKGPSN